MNRSRISRVFCACLCLFLSLTCHAAPNQVLLTTGTGAVLTAPWTCGQTALKVFTVSAWIAISETTASTDRVIVERMVQTPPSIPNGESNLLLNFQLGIDPQGYPFASYNGGGSAFLVKTVGPETVVKGKWTHVAAKLDGHNARLELYLNGQLVSYHLSADLPLNGILYSSRFGWIIYPSAMTIGASNGDPTGMTTNLNSYFSGKIDEVVIWDGVLTDSDIGSWMRRKPDGTESNLVAYWGFDNGSASDQSTNGIHGSFHNSTSSVERVTYRTTIGNIFTLLLLGQD